jgi:predicted aconitase
VESENIAARPLVTRHTLRESSRKLHILVAEDNAVNQAVILRVLEKMGHSSVLACTGKEGSRLPSTKSSIWFSWMSRCRRWTV